MAATTINPGAGNTTRYYDAATLALPDADWCIGIWYRPNLAAAAARLWDTGGPSAPSACYARVSHDVAGNGLEQQMGFRFIANDGAGVPALDVERAPNYPTGWAVDSDYLLIVQRRAGNLELHVCEKGGTTYSSTPVAWTLGALSPGTELIIGARPGPASLMENPYGEMFVLTGASLSTADINALKAGASILAVTATPTRYYKLRESNDPEPDLGTAGAHADQNGTGWATTTQFFNDSTSAPVLSAGTPSGTIGTQTTATIGATTDQSTGNFYVVVDSSANLAGVTATQIKAGQHAGGTAALASGDVAVSTTSPSVGVTGLVAGTSYAYAAIQNNANGDSNIVTGTFTTASAGAVSGLGFGRLSGYRIATLMTS